MRQNSTFLSRGMSSGFSLIEFMVSMATITCLSLMIVHVIITYRTLFDSTARSARDAVAGIAALRAINRAGSAQPTPELPLRVTGNRLLLGGGKRALVLLEGVTAFTVTPKMQNSEVIGVERNVHYAHRKVSSFQAATRRAYRCSSRF